MIKIVKPTQKLKNFLLMLNLNFSEPQKRHTLNFMDALLACEGTKTIAKLNRLIIDTQDQSAFTDFFTYSPWDLSVFRTQIMKSFVNWVLEENRDAFDEEPEPLFIKIDDSKSVKPKTSIHFEVTDWHFNTAESRGYFYGTTFITVHISCGKRSIPLTLRLYLRAKTVRRINYWRKQNNKKKIPFRTKLSIVKEVLKELKQFIPEDQPVYVLFDSWYASAKLIKFCRRRGWHVICALKRNRNFKKTVKQRFKQLSKMARYIRLKDFKSVILKSSDSSTQYLVHSMRGYLKEIKDEVSIFISKRHHKDRSPEFFMTTDLSLSAQEALSRYTRRWAVEVDHLYLKVRLGLGDFRLRSYEGISRYFELVCLTLAYLYWRRLIERDPDVITLSDVIELHRTDQTVASLKAFSKSVLENSSVDLAIESWIAKAA